VLKVVAPAIDGPNLCLVSGRARSASRRGLEARIGGSRRHCIGLFESADNPGDDTGVGPTPPETVALWVKLVAPMGPDERRTEYSAQ